MSKINTRIDLIEARLRADAARERFTSALQIVRERISPANLKDDAAGAVRQKTDEVRQSARHVLRRRPVLATIAATGAVGLLFWKPVRFVLLYGMRGAWLVWLNRAIRSQVNDK